ncbi:MAG TPA: hypothetical protein VMZ31_03170 [Phycisphaerae bacterium]|nr:hypothetical protein [Phycisphaerae bacterium]
MSEADKGVLRVGSNRATKLAFHRASVSSDGGLFPYRDPDVSSRCGVRRKIAQETLGCLGPGALYWYPRIPVWLPGKGQMGNVA